VSDRAGGPAAETRYAPTGTESPPALAHNIDEAIRAADPGQSLATATPEILVRAAERLFERSLIGGCTGRSSALDLLVIDALVTYAFERASDDPDDLEARADRVMARLAALANGPAPR